jgi:CheY-like chemotaxis protein
LGQVVACPITAGREVYGVLVFAWPHDEEPFYLGLAVVEVACNMMAIQRSHRRDEQRRQEGHHGDVRAARMAALGILAGGFAEELSAQLSEIERRLAEQQRVEGALRARLAAYEGHGSGAAKGASREASALAPADALQAARASAARFLAAIQPSAPGRVDLATIAADVLALAAPHLRRRRIDVELRSAGEHLVVGRKSELCQLLLHLVLGVAGVLDDSDDVCSDRGALIPRAFTLVLRRQGEHEVMSLCDVGEDGTGARSSFFEVGSPAGAPGFDLAVARRIVVAHEGHIEVGPAASPSEGRARCTIVLPAWGETERRAARSKLAEGGRRPLSDRPRPVLLWIDEDDLFLEIMVQSLPELDIRVARSATEAASFLAFGARPALVLCNVHLPDRAGHDLHAEIAHQNRDLAQRFVFVADGVLTPEIASYLIASGRPTLMRPIDVAEVRALIQQGARASIHPAMTAPTLVDTRRAETVSKIVAVRAEPPISTTHAPRETMVPEPPASSHDGAREKRTIPDRAALLPAGDVGEPSASGVQRARDQELAAIARATADTLRREGAKRGVTVLAMLRDRGLSEPEALSVITFALSTGVLVRDPHPSTLLRVPDNERRTVLVVDDDFDLRQTLREILEDEGYVVDTAANGREALDLLHRSNPPRVVVLDLMMPVMDGWQLLDELKRDDALSAVPVVVISASKTGLRAPHAHELLSKPLDYYKLITTLERSMTPAESLR